MRRRSVTYRTTLGRYTAIVWRDHDWQEYIVAHYVLAHDAALTRIADADYYTDCRRDAIDTANYWAVRSHNADMRD